MKDDIKNTKWTDDVFDPLVQKALKHYYLDLCRIHMNTKYGDEMGYKSAVDKNFKKDFKEYGELLDKLKINRGPK